MPARHAVAHMSQHRCAVWDPFHGNPSCGHRAELGFEGLPDFVIQPVRGRRGLSFADRDDADVLRYTQ
jgi:rubredoxin